MHLTAKRCNRIGIGKNASPAVYASPSAALQKGRFSSHSAPIPLPFPAPLSAIPLKSKALQKRPIKRLTRAAIICYYKSVRHFKRCK